MNYNSLLNRDFEIYNNYETTDFNSNPLINPKINDYFTNILNQPEPPKTYSVISKNDFTLKNFYQNYIEPNMLFIIIIIGFVIFLLIRYYTMDYEKKFADDDTDLTNDSDDSELGSKSKKKYKTKIKKYKKDLDDEKKKILDVIDELSSINYEERRYYSSLEQNYNQQLYQIKELQKKQEMQDLEEIQQLKELQEQLEMGKNLNKKQIQKQNQLPKPQLQSKRFIEPDRNPLDLTIKNNDTDTDDESNYYNIKKYNKKNKDDFISDIYIEPPYN